MVKKSNLICVVCGKEINCDELEGSLKHPYHKDCFFRVEGSDLMFTKVILKKK